MKLVERDMYIHWHKLKDEDVVHDIFLNTSRCSKIKQCMSFGIPHR